MSVGKDFQERRIGLIAGNGRFPILFAKEAKKQGTHIVAIAIKKDTNPVLRRFVDKLYWLKVKDFTKLFRILQDENIKEAIMAGQINPMHLFSKAASSSGELSDFLNSIEDKRADTIFNAIAKRLQSVGVSLIDSTTYLSDYLPKKGILTKASPDQDILDDINFGFCIAKTLGQADVGQTVVVKKRIVVAVEAVEGTDATIKRAGKIAGRGLVVVKTSKPNQDKRFDIPLVGLKTIKNLAKIKASCLAIEAEKTILLDRKKCIRFANSKNIHIVVQ